MELAAPATLSNILFDRIPDAEYRSRMILSFGDRKTEDLFRDHRVKSFSGFERQARRKLLLLNSAASLNDLRVPPGNRLEALRGVRAGQFSIRINDQWRVCFEWRDGGAWNVEIVDYH